MSVREILYKFAIWAYEISPCGVLKYNLMDNIKSVNRLLYILLFGSLKSFQLDNMICLKKIIWFFILFSNSIVERGEIGTLIQTVQLKTLVNTSPTTKLLP